MAAKLAMFRTVLLQGNINKCMARFCPCWLRHATVTAGPDYVLRQMDSNANKLVHVLRLPGGFLQLQLSKSRATPDTCATLPGRCADQGCRFLRLVSAGRTDCLHSNLELPDTIQRNAWSKRHAMSSSACLSVAFCVLHFVGRKTHLISLQPQQAKASSCQASRCVLMKCDDWTDEYDHRPHHP